MPIRKEILEQIRPKVCAIGVLEVPLEDFLQDLTSPHFRIFGSGFLVGNLVAMTNRHVLMRVAAHLEKNSLPEDRRYVVFTRIEGEGMAQSWHQFDKAGMAVEPSVFDVGMVTFRADPANPINQLAPVSIPSHFLAEVGDPVALYGYPYGENLLTRDTGAKRSLYRFGPILQQGHISGIAPFDHSKLVDRLLLDVRTTSGMSGSPVFDPETGAVLGIHDAGIDATVGFAIPLNSGMVQSLVTFHAAAAKKTMAEGQFSRTFRKPS